MGSIYDRQKDLLERPRGHTGPLPRYRRWFGTKVVTSGTRRRSRTVNDQWPFLAYDTEGATSVPVVPSLLDPTAATATEITGGRRFVCDCVAPGSCGAQWSIKTARSPAVTTASRAVPIVTPSA
ncbi:hypothetical protein EVAR_98354_1 [Eumeta japonica]|uniref:Uncharacterized protein n=1 Tax=Eumeta variegata TaxID=151549 RepID=A0A4C2AFS1_EUMVA|nr:hypothetical protein EVAR_98354_1 [Eumeta japonica]